jgi:hypothetical protein
MHHATTQESSPEEAVAATPSVQERQVPQLPAAPPSEDATGDTMDEDTEPAPDDAAGDTMDEDIEPPTEVTAPPPVEEGTAPTSDVNPNPVL